MAVGTSVQRQMWTCDNGSRLDWKSGALKGVGGSSPLVHAIYLEQ